MSALGHPRRHFRVTDSTNLRARALAAAGAPHGTTVSAAHQSAGRGRQGRRWSTAPGRALLVSVLLRHPPALLSLRAGIAVARVAEALDAAGRPSMVKWPNDVLLDGAKVAGILVEGRPHENWAVLGVGLNVGAAGDELPAGAASLGRAAGDVAEALRRTLTELESVLAADSDGVLAGLRARDALCGREVTWAQGRGIASGIDAGGRLMVATARGTVALDAGEVHLGARGDLAPSPASG